MVIWHSFFQYVITTYTVSFLVSLTGTSKTMTNNCDQQQLPSFIRDFTGKVSKGHKIKPSFGCWLVMEGVYYAEKVYFYS